MNKKLVAKELLAIAKSIMADVQVWEPISRSFSPSRRNVETIDSLTHFAPHLKRKMADQAVAMLNRQDFQVSPNDLKREWSEYLSLVDPRVNANKYHYYVVFSFKDSMGVQRYIALNCSGRVGNVERAYDLTEKFQGGVASTMTAAVNAAEQHMRAKLAKGYEPVPMVQG